MYLSRLFLSYFGKFHQKELLLKPGINIIYGENEAGKSTIHNFMKGMLFGIERLRGRVSASKEDTYHRYLPWNYPGAYQGQMDLVIGDQTFRIHRSFHANDKSFVITDLQTGREIRPEEGYICELIPGLTESTYKNTISIEQLKAQTDRELASQVSNYMANLSITKSNEVSVDQAVKRLNDQRKKLQGNGKQIELQQVQEAIQEGLAREEQMEQLMLQYKSMEQEQKLGQQQWDQSQMNCQEAWKRLDQYPVILEKYRTYLDYEKQWKQLDYQIRAIEEKIEAGDEEEETRELLMADIEEVEDYQERLQQMEDEQAEEEELERYEVRKLPVLLISFMLGIGLFILCYIILGSDKVGIGLLVGAISTVISLMLLSMLQRRKHQYDQVAEWEEENSSDHEVENSFPYEEDERNSDTKSYDQEDYDQEDYDQESYDRESYDQEDYDQESYDQEVYNQQDYQEKDGQEPYESNYGTGEMEPYEAELSSNIENIFIRYGVNSIEGLYELLEEWNHKKGLWQNQEIKIQGFEERKSQLEDYRDMLYDSIMGYMDQYFSVDELSEAAMLRLHEEVTNIKANYMEEEKEYKRTLDLFNSKKDRLQWEIDHLESNEADLLYNQEKYVNLQRQIEQDNKESEALRLALDTIQELSAEIHDSFGHQLNESVSRLMGEITADKYKNIKIDEKLTMKVEWKGNYIPLERLSAGTIDQVYLSMRLAIGDLLLEGEEVPLIFDDSFAMYDDGRIKMVMELLSERKQVILFTCHNREQKLLEEMGLPFHFVNLSR